jgi:hypothetical protein
MLKIKNRQEKNTQKRSFIGLNATIPKCFLQLGSGEQLAYLSKKGVQQGCLLK